MTGERWGQIEELLEEALALPPDERAAFLQQACSDGALREEVASLIQAYEEAAGLFDGVAGRVVGPAIDELQEGEEDGLRSSDPLGLEGTKVRRYAVEAHLGGGGMGVVYRARDTRLGREVALKFLPPHLATSAEAKARFIWEAKAASALDHPNIGYIHEIGETETEVGNVSVGQLFIAMAYYDGETLKEKLARKGPLPVEEAVGYAIQIAEGLAKAHEVGIIHRDVKPANVIVTEEGTVKLVDFGLARAAGQSGLTRTGQALGTVAYMSPEQARGEAVDARTDIWSLGAVLYEMLAGKRPFRGGHPAVVIYAILNEDPVPVGERREEVPPALAALIERLLQKDREERYAQASDVSADLHRLRNGGFQNEGELSTRPHGRANRSVSAVGHRRTVVVLSVLLALIAGLLAYPHVWDFESERGATSIAVLPFTYLAATDSANYFSLGMTDELLTRLGQIEGLSVIARFSVMQYQGTDKTILEIGKELGVDRIVDGSVQLAGGQVRIQAQLIDARTGAQLWAEGFTRPFRNVLELQSEITRRIAGALELELLPEAQRRLAQAPEVDSAAYVLYLQGRHLRFQETGPSLTEAVRLLQRSVALDSMFAPAWATLSTSMILARHNSADLPEGLGAVSVAQTLAMARTAARRAVALDSMSAEAHIAMGVLQRFPAAGPWLKQATLLNPGLANAQREYGLYLSRMGQFEEAGRCLREAVQLDPASPLPWAALAQKELFQGNYQEAKRHFEQALTLQSDHMFTLVYLAEAYLGLGETQAALRVARRTVEMNPSPFSLAELGRVYARTERPDSARVVLGRLREEFGHRPIREAIICAALGETDRALDLIEETKAASTPRVIPWWEALRGDLRYERLLEERGLDDASVRETMARLEAMDEPDQEAIP